MPNQQQVEVIRENLSPAEVLIIRRQEREAGNLVNIRRVAGDLVEIEIIHPPERPIEVINIAPPNSGRLELVRKEAFIEYHY